MTRSRLLVVSSVALFAALIGGPLACVGTTGGEKFDFEAQIGGIERDKEVPYTFTNEYGWAVTLTQADVTAGPLYLNTIAPLGGTAALWRWLSPVKEARADEAHLGEGRIVGEVLGQVRFSALSPSLVRFPVKGVISEEAVRSAEIWFYPPANTPPETLKISTVAIEVAGEAHREGALVKFHGKLTLNDDWLPNAQAGDKANTSISEIRQVRGIPVSFVPSPGGRLEIRVALAPLFASADFSNLTQNPQDPDDPEAQALVQSKSGKYTTDQVMRVLYQGLRSARGTYSVSWKNP